MPSPTSLTTAPPWPHSPMPGPSEVGAGWGQESRVALWQPPGVLGLANRLPFLLQEQVLGPRGQVTTQDQHPHRSTFLFLLLFKVFISGYKNKTYSL